tara:strand:+ start:287 stop:535 length:249 start_codon:yes stop_codon:yes gene_type:complete
MEKVISKESNGLGNMKRIITEFLKRRGEKMPKKKREQGLISIMKDWLSKFREELTDAYYDKPKPAPKRRGRPKRKAVKKKKS